MLPTATCNKHDDNPNEALLKSRAAPHDACACTSIEMDEVGLGEMHMFIGELQEPIYEASYMVGHKVERTGDVDSKPSDHTAPFIAQYSELPEIISRKQCHDEQYNVVVRTEWLNIFLYLLCHLESNSVAV